MLTQWRCDIIWCTTKIFSVPKPRCDRSYCEKQKHLRRRHHLWPTSGCQMLFVLDEAAGVELSIFSCSHKGHTWLLSVTPDRHSVALCPRQPQTEMRRERSSLRRLYFELGAHGGMTCAAVGARWMGGRDT